MVIYFICLQLMAMTTAEGRERSAKIKALLKINKESEEKDREDTETNAVSKEYEDNEVGEAQLDEDISSKKPCFCVLTEEPCNDNDFMM